MSEGSGGNGRLCSSPRVSLLLDLASAGHLVALAILLTLDLLQFLRHGSVNSLVLKPMVNLLPENYVTVDFQSVFGNFGVIIYLPI
jgi:hypothetical protein